MSSAATISFSSTIYGSLISVKIIILPLSHTYLGSYQDTLLWTKLENCTSDPNKPCRRMGHTAVVYQEHMYVRPYLTQPLLILLRYYVGGYLAASQTMPRVSMIYGNIILVRQNLVLYKLLTYLLLFREVGVDKSRIPRRGGIEIRTYSRCGWRFHVHIRRQREFYCNP